MAFHRYKGRLVYRGDDTRDQDGCHVVSDPLEPSTNPRALVALNLAVFFRMMHGHVLSISDAIQAFLQAPLLEETWVVLGEELWFPHWFDRYPKGAKLCVRLWKSLYGHPLAGKLWQNYLTEKLAALNAVEVEGFPSNYLIQYGSKWSLFNVYVDDLTLSGDESLHQQFWDDFRRYINIEEVIV